jgi:hypothetical protein
MKGGHTDGRRRHLSPGAGHIVNAVYLAVIVALMALVVIARFKTR